MFPLAPRVLVATVLALLYGFLNGIHDSGNIVSTVIASRALSLGKALLLASVTVLAAPLLLGLSVARTIGAEIVDVSVINPEVIIAALVGAILWNLITWWLGLPSSSSHALIGGILGSVLVRLGPEVIKLRGVQKTLLALLLAPLAGLVGGYLAMKLTRLLASRASPRVNVLFRRGQTVTALALALGHGANDAQIGMGVITMALVTSGSQSAFLVPDWVKLTTSLALALGTALGGRRIIRTLSSRFYRIRPIHGFTSQLSSAAVVLAATLLGGPVSSTQVVSSAIMGAGAAERVSKVRWGVGRSIATAWVVTMPASGLIGAGAYLALAAIW